jgi:hypothetical protein
MCADLHGSIAYFLAAATSFLVGGCDCAVKAQELSMRYAVLLPVSNAVGIQATVGSCRLRSYESVLYPQPRVRYSRSLCDISASGYATRQCTCVSSDLFVTVQCAAVLYHERCACNSCPMSKQRVLLVVLLLVWGKALIH